MDLADERIGYPESAPLEEREPDHPFDPEVFDLNAVNFRLGSIQ